MLLLGDAFEGFLRHSVELTFRPERHDEAVMEGQDGGVTFNELLDDVFTKLGIESQLAQASNFFFGMLIGCVRAHS